MFIPAIGKMIYGQISHSFHNGVHFSDAFSFFTFSRGRLDFIWHFANVAAKVSRSIEMMAQCSAVYVMNKDVLEAHRQGAENR